MRADDVALTAIRRTADDGATYVLVGFAPTNRQRSLRALDRMRRKPDMRCRRRICGHGSRCYDAIPKAHYTATERRDRGYRVRAQGPAFCQRLLCLDHPSGGIVDLKIPRCAIHANTIALGTAHASLGA